MLCSSAVKEVAGGIDGVVSVEGFDGVVDVVDGGVTGVPEVVDVGEDGAEPVEGAGIDC